MPTDAPSKRILLAFLIATGVVAAHAQTLSSMPATSGETLSGKRLVLSDAVKNQPAILVIGFSQQAGDGCGLWANALHSDPALAGTLIYEAAMLEKAPSFLRGMIKSSMRKGLTPAQQDAFVVLTQDEKLWRAWLDVSEDKDPYVVLLDSSGKILWHGHGAAKDLESQLRAGRR